MAQKRNKSSHTILGNLLNGPLNRLYSLPSCYKHKPEIVNNSPEAFNIDPVSVIIDGSRSTKQFYKEDNKESKTSSHNISCHLLNSLNSEDLESYANMTQPKKSCESPNSAKVIYNIEKTLVKSAQKFMKEANKENRSEFEALKSYSPCKACSGTKKVLQYLEDGQLNMAEKFKGKQEDALPDDLQGVAVDPNLFTEIQSLTMDNVVNLYGVECNR